MPRLKMLLAYTGTHFQGWQVQPGARTVQGCLEKVLGRICAAPVRVHGSGRTDSGVHALGQVAHADVPESRRHVPWIRALNRMLPEDMAVLQADYVPARFHAQYSACGKDYVYSLWIHPDYVVPQRRPFVWWVKGVDIERMRQGAEILTGEHDFAAFQNVGTPVRSTVRRLWRIGIRQAGDEIECSFVADGFLKQMVRNLIAALVAVGKGTLSPDELCSLLHSRDRRLGPATAPARGLTLTRVLYERSEFQVDEECTWRS